MAPAYEINNIIPLDQVQFAPDEQGGIIPLDQVQFAPDEQEGIIPLDQVQFAQDEPVLEEEPALRTGIIPDESLGRPISAITGKPIPTFEEKIEGAKAFASVPGYAFAKAIRGAVPKGVESAIRKFDSPYLHMENYDLAGEDTREKKEYSFKNPPSLIDDLVGLTGKNIPEGTGKGIIGGVAEMAGAAVPITGAAKGASGIIKASEKILKTLGVSTDLVLKKSPVIKSLINFFSHGATTGALYGMMEEGTPKEVANEALFFGAIEAVFGTAGPVVQKITESAWFRGLKIKERGLVVQTVKSMKDAGRTDVEILKGVMGEERDKFFAEVLEKQKGKVKLTPDKPVEQKPGKRDEAEVQKAAEEHGISIKFQGTQEGFGKIPSTELYNITSGVAKGATIGFRDFSPEAIRSKIKESVESFSEKDITKASGGEDITKEPETITGLPVQEIEKQPELTGLSAEIKTEDDKISVDITKKEADSLTPKQQKEYLIDEIDVAIKNAKSGKVSAPEDWGADLLKKNQEKFGKVVIEVPGDGKFTLINNRNSLEAFKKQVKKLPSSAVIDSKKKRPSVSTKPANQRITGEGIQYYNPYKPKKQELIENKEKQYWRDGYFSNSYYLIETGDKPKLKHPIAEGEKAPDMKGLIKSDYTDKQLTPAKIAGMFYSGDLKVEDGIVYTDVVSNDGEIRTFIDVEYIDSVTTQYPEAKIFINKNNGAAAFRENDKVVAVIMPSKFSGTPERNLQQKALDEFAASGYTRLYDSKKEKPVGARHKNKQRSNLAPAYQMAGVQAETAPTGALAKAQKMLAEGKNDREIWSKTGWIKTPDNKWKFEIDDSEAKLKDLGVGKKMHKMSDVLDHKELYVAYPELKEIRIHSDLDYKDKWTEGSYFHGKGLEGDILSRGRIMLSGNPDKAMGTLLHEIQHAIQHIEGFGHGGSPAMFEEIKNKKVKELTFTVNNISDALEKYKQEGKKVKYAATLKEKQKLLDRIEDIKKSDSYKKYFRLAGEIEARDTQARAKLNKAWRSRTTMPYESQNIPREGWIVIDEKGTSFSVEEKVEKKFSSKAKEKTTPERVESPGLAYNMGDHGNVPVMMEMPELIQLFKDLSSGKYPEIAKIIRAGSGHAAGVFYPKTGKIKLQKDIFQNSKEATKVLAHEMGHWIDWLPDKDIKRGNILGRVASLKKYMSHWLDDILGGPGRITDAEKKILKAEAKKLAGGEKWIDEVINETIPITPQDVIDIWNSMIPREALVQDLLDYIMRIGTAEKKAIVVAAMKGMVADEIKHIASIVKRTTGKKIKVKIKAGDKEIIDKFNELLAAELKKRNIYNRDEIAQELKEFTHQWKPFDQSSNPEYTKYRYSGIELYADALSGILTNPDVFRQTAPKFWSAWNTWLHRKPEFMDAWDAWQAKTKRGSVEITKDRMKNIYEMFEKNDKARIDEAMEQRKGSVVSAYDGLMTYFWDKNHKALGLLRSLKKKGGAEAEHATQTRDMIEEANYISSEISVFVGDVFEQVINPLEALGHDAKELGLVLFQKRILGDRSKVGNPLGHSPETTNVDIENIEKTIWGAKKTKEINDFANQLRRIREDFVLPLIEQSGLATPEFMEFIKDTKTYATFSNVEWFKKKGFAGPGATFYRQIGTFGEIENPLVSVILKDMSLMRAARINMTKRELVIDMLYSNVTQRAKMRYSKDASTMIPIPPPDSKQAVFSFMDKGDPQYFYASKKIVDMFAYVPVEAQQIAMAWRMFSQPVKEILVSKNPAWMARNVFRDVRQTIKNVPEVKLRKTPKFLYEYIKAFKETTKYVFKGEKSPAIREMLITKALPLNRIWSGYDETFESELDKMAADLNFAKKQNDESFFAIRAVKKIWDNIDKIGKVSDFWGKVAGWKYLKKYSVRPQREMAHVTRTRIGTPDYLRTGSGQQITNNLFMFSNIGKEGIRAAIESATEDPGGYAWKTIATNIMPKLMIGALGSGAAIWGISKLSDDDDDIKYVQMLQRTIKGIPEYDLANYTIIPLGITKQGKSAYLRIPEDYEGQFWGAIVHKLITGRIFGHEGGLNLVREQSPYKTHPYIKVISNLITYYIKGQNPVDEYRGNKIMSERTYAAGGSRAHKAMLKSTWKELGLKLIYEPPWDGLEKDEEVYEKALRTFPLNALGSFLRFSDQGITERIEKELQEFRKTKAKISLEKTEAFIQMANGDKITQKQMALILSDKGHVIRDKVISLLGRKYGDAYVRQLTRPGLSNDEKELIIDLMINDQQKGE